jgi:hypothetical protein
VGFVTDFGVTVCAQNRLKFKENRNMKAVRVALVAIVVVGICMKVVIENAFLNAHTEGVHASGNW